jgi:hypothetical protein
MGFAAVLVLMLFLTAVGLVQLEASQRRLEGVVDVESPYATTYRTRRRTVKRARG